MFIAGGATTVTLAVSTEDDTTDEPDGIITAELTAGAGYTVGTLSTALVTVNDNDIPDPDAPVASISADPTPITEGTAATFTVTLDRVAPAGGLTISVAVTESGSYIVGSASATVVIAEGETTGTLVVSTDDDEMIEETGIITAELNVGTGYAVADAPDNAAVVTVLDNDTPVARITANPLPIIEGVAATFRVTLSSAAPTGGLTVSVAVTESGSYIADLAPTEVFITAGATTVTLAVSTDDDEMGERSGSITVRIIRGTGYTVADAPDNEAAVTVLDNDTPAARISADATPITEGTAATFRVTLGSAAPADGLTINVDVTESGSYIVGAAPATVVIASGATTGTLVVSTDDDAVIEETGIITAELNAGTGYTVADAPDNAAVVTVLDDDTPVASILADILTITEGTAATFTVALDRVAPAGGLTINVGVTESGSYIAGLAPATVVIAEGETTVTLAVSTEDDTTDEPDGIITAELNAGADYAVGTPSTALVTVNDNDDPVARITANPLPIIEGVAATFRVTLSSAAPVDGVTVSVAVTESGSYIAGSAPTEVFITAGATTGTLAVSTDDDEMGERSGSITVRIITGVGYTVAAAPDNAAAVTVLDNDTPAARISADATPITEGTAATFRVTLGSAAPAGGLTISVAVTESGSYIVGAAPATVFIASGATTGTLVVSTDDDAMIEETGIITAELNAGTGYTVADAPDNAAVVTVLDDDTPVASILADILTITEGTAATFTVALDRVAPAGGLTISVGVTESGSYISGLAPTEVFIAAGATTDTLTVSTEDDSLDESTGAITAELNVGTGYTVGTLSTARVTVNDNDVLLASISADPTPITEGTAATFRVTLDSAAPAGGLTVSVAVTESGSYIDGAAPTEVVIAEGARTGMLTVLTDNDEMGERSGSITVRITTGAGYTVGTPSTALVTVFDNDTPAARISAGPSPIIEGVAATFRVTLGSAAPAGGLTISVGVTESGSYIAGSAPTAVFIAGGATTVTLTVSTADDDMGERSGSITVRITTGAGYTVGNPSTALVTVLDNDTPACWRSDARISAGPTTITEGAAATFRVTLGSAAPASGLTISVGVTESGSYIAGSAPTAVFIAGGATTVTLAVSTEDDTTDEPDGIITAELTAGAGYTVGTLSTALVTVNDNDIPDPDAPVASISADPTPITEGTAATFTVTLDRVAPAGGLTISVAVTESGSYIVGSASATVVIAEGETTGTLVVSTDDDEMIEETGIITAELNVGTGYAVADAPDNAAVVTVLDNDTPVARITANPLPIIEGVAATFRVTLSSAAPTGGLTVSVAVTESGSYIADLAPTEVFITAGATTVTLAVSTDDDEMGERSGSITVRIIRGTGYTVADAPDNEAAVTVLDNDTPAARISADATPITEGTAATFRVTLGSAAPAGGLTINVDVTESGSYIVGAAPATVVIASGATTGTLVVSTDDDAVIEETGIITAELNAGTGYTVADAPDNAAVVTVLDDDTPVASILADILTITEGTAATFTVALDRVAPAGGLTINVGVTESGSYIAGLAPATVVIAEGETTVTLAVSTEDDTTDEPDGIITAELNAGADYAVGTPSTALVTVNDNDDPVARITANPLPIIEGVAATFRVTLSSAAPVDGVTVSVGVTESGSYIAETAPETVFIAGGATTVTLAVLTDNDEMGERSGSITVQITTGAGYTVGTPSTALVTVFDNDTPAARISADPTPITEGTAATFRVTLGSAAPAGGLTISVAVTESGSYIVRFGTDDGGHCFRRNDWHTGGLNRR